MENERLSEKLAELQKKYQGKKDEIRRLAKYEAFFEKQRQKKYRNCGCQVGQSYHAKNLVIRDKRTGAVITRKGKENVSTSPVVFKVSPATPQGSSVPLAAVSTSPNNQDSNALLQYHVK